MEITIMPHSEPGLPPRGFFLGDNRKLIDMVLDRWPGKGYLYLKVRANDGAIYILRREDASGRWELWLFDAGAEGALPPLSGR